MAPTIRRVTAEDIRDFATWRYDPPYDTYDITLPPEEAVDYFLSPDAGCHALIGDGDVLVGFCTFGVDGRVPGGDYSEPALDIGLGIRPSLTGGGNGRAYVQTVVEYATESFGADRLRVTVAAWNDRARHVWTAAGFAEAQRFEAPADVMGGGAFLILVG